MSKIIPILGLAGAFFALGNQVAAGENPPLVQSPSAEIRYEVNESALPLDSVELFVTTDQGATWRLWGTDDDRHPPVLFHTEHEGLHGFFVVLNNAAGTSAPPPQPSTPPQFSALFDWTAPIAQLHEPRQSQSLGQTILQIRWTAVDAHFPARPVELQFRRASEDSWQAVAPEPLANTGRYDWRVPEGLTGPIQLRLIVSDLAGHRVESPPRPVEIVPEAPPEKSQAPPRTPGAPASTAPTPSSRQRATKLFEEAVALRDARLDREAISRFREVVRLDPTRADALVEMGDLLYRLGDAERALSAYDTALLQQPELVPALRGSATIAMQRRDYATAGERFRRIVRIHPTDAATWIKLGDVAVFQGDEIAARDCYLRAATADPAAAELIDEANNRLALMGSAMRTSAAAGRK